jgi:hypothetical protein
MLALIFSCLYGSYLYGQDSPDNARAVIRKVQPQYPALAQRMSIKGSVKLEVVVEPDGSVKSLNTKGGPCSGAGRARCNSTMEMAGRVT